MLKELKARIEDRKSVEQKLLKIGAKFSSESEYVYTYLNQPIGKVLKLTYHNGKVYKTIIEVLGDRFSILSNNEIKDPAEAVYIQLERRYGVKKRLKNSRRFYSYQGDEITTNKIDGEEPNSDILNKLGIGQSAVITDSFANL